MDQFEVHHSCEEMATGFATSSSCVEVAGLGIGGIIVAVLIVAALGLVGWLLWRRIRDRSE